METRVLLVSALMLGFTAISCDSPGGGGGTPVVTADPGASSSDTKPPDTTKQVDDLGTPDVGPTADEGPTSDTSGLPYVDGCITFEGAKAFCGFGSDEVMCTFAATCRTDGDIGQCQIDCEMGTTMGCIGPADIQCIIDAVEAQSCDDLKGCAFKLVY